jgi:multidrug efflux system membrane fusion protein
MKAELKSTIAGLAAVFILLPSSFFILSCSKSGETRADTKAGGKRSMEFPVEVKAVESRRVEYTVTAVGSLDAFERVAVTARVAGAVEKVNFREGQIVNTGYTLVEIEPERYRLAVAAAEAALQKAGPRRARRRRATRAASRPARRTRA